MFGPPWERKYTGVRGIGDVEYRSECGRLVVTDEVLFSGDVEARCVIVLAQRSKGVERGYIEIARMRQMIDVSIPMRAYCIGDEVACRPRGFIFSVIRVVV